MYTNILIPIMLGTDVNLERSFKAAQALADPNAKLTVIHVNEPIPSFAIGEFPSDVLMHAQSDMRTALDEAAAKLPGAASALLIGRPGHEIIKYAEDHGVDCIVIASHQPEFSDYFLGSTASRVVRHATCCVHVLR